MTNKLQQSLSKMRLGAASHVIAVTVILVAGIAAQPAQSQTYKILHGFRGAPDDGASPVASVILDAQGNLYGTTAAGGTSACSCGTVFKLDSNGVETVLYNFTGPPDGSNPSASLTFDAAGNLYGTTTSGGTGSCSSGCGTVFKLDTSGVETVLYNFTGSPDGAYPSANLIFDAKGNFYGTTANGGTGSCSHGCGIVFKLDSSGKETVQYSFAGSPDGAYPTASLILDTNGNLYGTTSQGGSGTKCGGGQGCGTVFKLDTSGVETVMYSFTGGADGSNPHAALIRDAKDNFYSTTIAGGKGCQGGCGTVFKLAANGKETVLHEFGQNGKGDGVNPYAPLVRDDAGNLYGTAAKGGGWDGGAVFKLDTAGKETILYHFGEAHGIGLNGARPLAGLTRSAKGDLYGTASMGGHKPPHVGVVFEIIP